MTYKERLKKEKPEKVYEGAIDSILVKYSSGCWGCPGDYWGGAPSLLVQSCCNRDCTKCWNTEIPNYPANSHPGKVDEEYMKRDIEVTRAVAKRVLNQIYGIKPDNAIKYSTFKPWGLPQIEDVIFNDPATIVFWNDGTKTVVKTQNGEPFDPEKGLAMAITAVVPDWYKGEWVYRKLAPTFDIVREYKHTGDRNRYIKRYKTEVLGKLDPVEVIAELRDLSNGEPICLMCYEKPDSFCHRHLVAEWLTENGCECKETYIGG